MFNSDKLKPEKTAQFEIVGIEIVSDAIAKKRFKPFNTLSIKNILKYWENYSFLVIQKLL